MLFFISQSDCIILRHFMIILLKVRHNNLTWQPLLMRKSFTIFFGIIIIDFSCLRRRMYSQFATWVVCKIISRRNIICPGVIWDVMWIVKLMANDIDIIFFSKKHCLAWSGLDRWCEENEDGCWWRREHVKGWSWLVDFLL